MQLPDIQVPWRTNEGSENWLPVNNILAIGKNYADHVAELNWRNQEPVFFTKPRTSLVTEGGAVTLPDFSEQIHYELELVLFVGKGGKAIPLEKAFDHILAVGLGVDFTARDVQVQAKEKGSPWAVAKGFDGAAYVSRLIPPEILHERESLSMFLWRDQQLRQKGDLSNMIFAPEEILSRISNFLTLYPGDIIFTGTPAGVGSVYSGNKILLQLKREEHILLDSRFVIN